VQPEARQIHICHRARCVKARENVTQFFHMSCKNTTRVVLFVKGLSPRWRIDRIMMIERNA
jgi:hypothetical protein